MLGVLVLIALWSYTMMVLELSAVQPTQAQQAYNNKNSVKSFKNLIDAMENECVGTVIIKDLHQEQNRDKKAWFVTFTRNYCK